MVFSWQAIRRFVRRSLTENLGLKLVALVIALVLITVVRFQEKVERGVDVEVNVKWPSDSASVVLTSDFPKTVRVVVRGRPSLLKDDRIKDCELKMDMSDKTEKESFTFYFEPGMVEGLPSGVEAVQVTPDAVLVRVEKVISKKLPIRVKTTGRPRNGTHLEDKPSVIPSEVTVSGPTSLVRPMTRVFTDVVDIEDKEVGQHVEKVPLQRIDGVSINYTENLTVSFKVGWTLGQRVVSGLLVHLKNEDVDGIEIRPSEVAVSLSGPQVALDRLDPGILLPVVDVTGVEPDKSGITRVKVEVVGYPPDIKIHSIVPASVMVKLPESLVKSKKLPPPDRL